MGLIKQIFSQIKQNKVFCFLSRNKSTLLGSALVSFVGIFLFIQPTHAGILETIVDPVGNIAGTIAKNLFSLIIGILIALVHLLQDLTIMFLELFIQVAEYNEFTNEEVVKLGWEMVRDVANMFFIVALIVIAFANILGLSKYEMKSALPMLFMMAILVNFSKLIAGVIIDAAHVFTITFLNAVAASAGGNLVGAFGMDELWKIPESEFSTGIQTQTFLSAVYGLAITLITMITMGAYFIILLIRMVVLWILIILSPLAFAAAALPETRQKFSSQWWSRFLNHVLVAPALVFFLWLAFATMGGGDIGGSVMSAGEQGAPGKSLENITVGLASWNKFLSFIITVGFLWAGLEFIQSEMNVRGGKVAGKARGIIRSGARKTVSTGAAVGKSVSGYNAARDYTKMGAHKVGQKLRGTKVGQALSSQQRKAKLEEVESETEAQTERLRGEGREDLYEGRGVTGKVFGGEEAVKERVKRGEQESETALAKQKMEKIAKGVEERVAEFETQRSSLRENVGEKKDEYSDSYTASEATKSSYQEGDVKDAVQDLVTTFELDADDGVEALREVSQNISDSDNLAEDPEKAVQAYLDALAGGDADTDVNLQNGNLVDSSGDQIDLQETIEMELSEQGVDSDQQNALASELAKKLKSASKEGHVNLDAFDVKGNTGEVDVKDLDEAGVDRAKKVDGRKHDNLAAAGGASDLDELSGDLTDNSGNLENAGRQLAEVINDWDPEDITGKQREQIRDLEEEDREGVEALMGHLAREKGNNELVDKMRKDVLKGEADVSEYAGESAQELRAGIEELRSTVQDLSSEIEDLEDVSSDSEDAVASRLTKIARDGDNNVNLQNTNNIRNEILNAVDTADTEQELEHELNRLVQSGLNDLDTADTDEIDKIRESAKQKLRAEQRREELEEERDNLVGEGGERLREAGVRNMNW